jgi:hypothetical protein
MKGTKSTKPTNNRKKRRAPPSDPLLLEHSKRHGKAVKKGIRKAKKVKHEVLRAVSRAKGKSKAQVAAELLEGTRAATEEVAARTPALGYSPDSPSALCCQEES